MGNVLFCKWNLTLKCWCLLELTDFIQKMAETLSYFFDQSEYEQINAVNEIVNKIHETNTRSLSAILVNEKEESRF
jgi:hypothetical protein